MRRLKKRERLMLKRAQLPEGEHTAINAEIKAVAEQLARLEAVKQRATEPAPWSLNGSTRLPRARWPTPPVPSRRSSTFDRGRRMRRDGPSVRSSN
jgi:hypothetical protein